MITTKPTMLLNSFYTVLYWNSTVFLYIKGTIYFNLFKRDSRCKVNKIFFLSPVNTNSYFDFYNFIFYSGIFYNNMLHFKKNIKQLAFLFIYFWARITFRGKGFRVRKFSQSRKLTFNFGRSHWTKLLCQNFYIFIRKIRRQNYVLICSVFTQFYSIANILRHVKLINWYTKRGLRLKKQRVKKRFGKISQMISSLHF